jgi:hypothetical protein
MTRAGIISRSESLRILKNDLRKTALEKHATELAQAKPADRQELINRIDRDIEKELRRRTMLVEPDSLIH